MHVVSACPVCADGKGAKREAGRCAFRPARGRYIANQKKTSRRENREGKKKSLAPSWNGIIIASLLLYIVGPSKSFALIQSVVESDALALVFDRER